MKFGDIPQLTQCHYAVDISWTYLETQLDSYREQGLELEPEYQRGHVWSNEQRSRFVEWGLKGGRSGMEILFNCPNWMRRFQSKIELVDGLQRVTAVRMFMCEEIPAFGCFRREYEDKMSPFEPRFRFHVNDLAKRSDILKWYIDMNAGGVVHSPEEIQKVVHLYRAALKKEKKEKREEE
jgi:hypothetical protein